MERERPLTEQQLAVVDYVRRNPGGMVCMAVWAGYPTTSRKNTSAKLRPLIDRGLVRVEYPDRHRAAVYPVVR